MTDLPAPTRPAAPQGWDRLPFFQHDWPPLWERLCAAPAPWTPEPQSIFRALALTPPEAVKVVILGQDPYHTPGRATGLAFGFPAEAPPRDSLRNILTEVASDIGAAPQTGDLTGWAQQGVLLLNTVLTVPLGEAHGHKGWGWEKLVRQILDHLAATQPTAFILWGAPAQKLCAKLPREGHLFHQSAHPSPLSAYRGFFGSKPFSTVNDWLRASGRAEIDWSA